MMTTTTCYSLKHKIQAMLKDCADEGEILATSEYDNLILDELTIESLTVEDRDFLSTFTCLEHLSLKQTSLKSLQNLPRNLNIVRLDLSCNDLTGDQLVYLSEYSKTLHTLKLGSNKLNTVEDV